MDQVDGDPGRIAASQRCSVVLPAGAGKTELIARSVAQPDGSGGRDLILTHTHAGVAAIRSRLRRLKVSANRYRVRTLDGFALLFVSHYPQLSGVACAEPEDSEAWNEIRSGAERMFRSRHIQRVVQETYDGLYVDEYQDCSRLQHAMVLRLAEALPTRIFGDPLQGIFDFGEGVVSWANSVAPEFPRMDVTVRNWRWLDTNPRLGEWLRVVRRHLREGRRIDLRPVDVGVKWLPQRRENQVQACHKAAVEGVDVVAIQKWAGQCHSMAKRLNGSYSSMEELAGKDLIRAAAAIDEAIEGERAARLIGFAKACMTRLPPGLDRAADRFSKGKRPRLSKGRKNLELFEKLTVVAEESGPEVLHEAMESFERLSGAFVHRKECWHEMKRALRIWQYEPEADTLTDACLRIRERTRRIGRVEVRRSVSRPLLIKGLEYDHCILLDADQLKDARELYVALTRGRSAVTVLSEQPTVKREPFSF